jgi:hypothetical protein
LCLFNTIFKSKGEAIQVHSSKSFQNMASRDEFVRSMVKMCCISSNTTNIWKGCGHWNLLLHWVIIGDVSIKELAMRVTFILVETTNEVKIMIGHNSFVMSFVLKSCTRCHAMLVGYPIKSKLS